MNQSNQLVSAVTRDIQVSVQSFFLPERSEPDKKVYVYAYHIQIENQGSKTVQLLRRHWIITDGEGTKKDVEGEGVVGEQPILQPYTEYEYTSGSHLETPVGTMEGKYTMVDEYGEFFDVDIPCFLLSVPGSIH